VNIYKQELKFYRRSAIIWMVVFGLGVFGYMSLLPAFARDVAGSLKILEAFPPALRAALGIRLDIFFTVFGFFGYLLTYMWLVGAIQAMNLGTGIISKEISGKTADFLLSKPVSRFKVLTSKLLAVLTIIMLTNIVFVVASLLSALVFSSASFDISKFLLLCTTMVFVQLFFLALGFLVSMLVPKIKTVLAYTLPIVFGFFIVGLLDSVIGTEAIRYVTPFKYFDITYILASNGFDPKFLLTDMAVIVVCIILTYVIYLRKDVQAPA
jgi:ABC-2 type transport system permease protein